MPPVKFQPRTTEQLCELGEQFLGRRDYKSALDSFRSALKLSNNSARAHRGLAFALDNIGNLTDAEVHYRKVLELEPQELNAVAGLAYILQRRGGFYEAKELLDPFVDSGSTNASIAYVYSWLCSRFNSCDKAIIMINSVLKRKNLGLSSRTMLLFSLGKLYDKRADYGKAFNQFKLGNELSERLYDADKTHNKFESLMEFFNKKTISRLPRAKILDVNMVFIVGMPRTGSTLVEQILASHPDVYGAGEMEMIARVADRLSNTAGASGQCPENLDNTSVEELTSIAERCMGNFSMESKGAKYIIDKTPMNFLYLGLISLIFPNARIVHCVRNPMDTCLSCFFHDFIGDNYDFTYNLNSLGVYYNEYHRLMKHWEAVLDIPIFTVRYENMVENPEELSRAVVGFCKLPWDDCCLKFYESDREVKTSSFEQVRQPVYKASLAKHVHYDQYLEPLRVSLGSLSAN